MLETSTTSAAKSTRTPRALARRPPARAKARRAAPRAMGVGRHSIAAAAPAGKSASETRVAHQQRLHRLGRLPAQRMYGRQQTYVELHDLHGVGMYEGSILLHYGLGLNLCERGQELVRRYMRGNRRLRTQ